MRLNLFFFLTIFGVSACDSEKFINTMPSQGVGKRAISPTESDANSRASQAANQEASQATNQATNQEASQATPTATSTTTPTVAPSIEPTSIPTVVPSTTATLTPSVTPAPLSPVANVEVSCAQQILSGPLSVSNYLLENMSLEGKCIQTKTEEQIIPGPTDIDFIFLLDRTGLDGTLNSLWSSIATIETKTKTLVTNLKAQGRSVRISALDYRYAPIYDWHVPLTNDVSVFAATMLPASKNPLDEMWVIDPNLDWLADPEHWLYYDANYSTSFANAGQWAFGEALSKIKQDMVAVPGKAKAEKVFFWLTDAVAYSGKKPGSNSTTTLKNTLQSGIDTGMKARVYYSAPDSHSELFAGLTPKKQLDAFAKSLSGATSRAFGFPLTEDILANQVASEFLDKKVTSTVEYQCFISEAQLTSSDGTAKIASYKPLSLLEAKANAEKGFIKILSSQTLLIGTEILSVTQCCAYDNVKCAYTTTQTKAIKVK